MSSLVLKLPLLATGASFTAFTVMLDRGHVRVCKSIVGLEGERVRAVVIRRRRVRERSIRVERDRPVRGPATRRKVKGSLSASVAVTLPLSAVSSLVVKLPLLATGALFVPRTFTATAPMSVPPSPSEMV